MSDHGSNPFVQFAPVHFEQPFWQTRCIGRTQEVMQREERLALRIHDVSEAFARFGKSLSYGMRILDRMHELFADVAERHALPDFLGRVSRTVR